MNPVVDLSKLRAPVFVAPMFLVSGPELVVASCRAGLVGSFPTQNARTSTDLKEWLEQIQDGLADVPDAQWAVSQIVHPTYDRFADDLVLIEQYQPTIVVTALGSPARVLDRVHAYGGAVYADVMSVEHARKAADAGADGLVLVCHGAGGHTGRLSAFAFVEAVREFFDGDLVVGGAISTGRGVRAAETLGADLAYLGTKFIATQESQAGEEYRQMLVRAGIADVTATAAVTGVLCSWLDESLEQAGLSDTDLTAEARIDFSDPHGDHKPWKNIFGAGQGVASIDSVPTVAEVADRIVEEYRAVLARQAGA